jgi:hypothetical protein
LVRQNASNEEELTKLADLFDEEIDQTFDAITENTGSEPDDGGEPDDGEFEPSGNTPADPTGGGRGGGKSGSKKASK